MGLLDDAIREHLELKRQRGADPGEVARDERAALGPVESGEEVEEYGFAEPGYVDEEAYDEDEPPVEQGAEGSGEVDPSSEGAARPRASEETMEVDMRTILDADQGGEGAELECSGDAMVANTADCGASSAQTSNGSEGAAAPAGWGARKRHRRSTARAARALGLGRGSSVEGSLP